MYRDNFLKGKFYSLCLLLLASLFSIGVASAQDNLPVIGDGSSSSISLEEERRLGNMWLRVLRGRATQYRDPFVYEYTNDLLYQLVTHSAVVDKQLQLVLLKNNTLNAFAVPGGIIGIHSGLYNYAKTEGQFASVLAHELAHLSQRHYANSVEEQRRNMPLQLATLFGAILVAATSGDSNATAATLASGQAALVDKRLAFSRQNEREADDIGMELLVRAGYLPGTMPDMFSEMMKSSRFQGSQIPEFLRTHPITQSRIAESQNRAIQLGSQGREDSQNYQFIRARVLVDSSDNPERLLNHYNSLKAPSDADRYIHAAAAIAANRPNQAASSVQALVEKYPGNLYVLALEIEHLQAISSLSAAENKIKQLLSLYPGYYPLAQLYIDNLVAQKRYQDVSPLLEKLLRRYPDNDFLWFQLAENEGQLGHITEVHKARAEFYLLRANTKMAEGHLNQALRSSNLTRQEKAVLEARLEDVKTLRDALDF